jgi:DNA polymerase sigma
MIDFSVFSLAHAPELHGYGSFMNGFGTAGSDIDSMICTQSFIDERQILTYI